MSSLGVLLLVLGNVSVTGSWVSGLPSDLKLFQGAPNFGKMSNSYLP